MKPCLSAQTLLPALSVLCAAITLTALMTIAGTPAPVAAQDALSPDDPEYYANVCVPGSGAITNVGEPSQSRRINMCKILLAAKETLLGTADPNTLNWTTTLDMDGEPSWTGLEIAGGTFQLDLNSLSFNGRIPPVLGTFTDPILTNLWLHNNELTGPIPPALGNLTNLQQLNLSDNKLTGTIPAALGNLTNLTDLRLNNNQLTDPIPRELGNLTQLTQLRLNNNQLTGNIPAALGNLTICCS